jgi:hypothetical protein
MKKLVAGAIVAAALTVPATPALAIHHGTLPFVPECAQSENSLGVPAFFGPQGPPNLGVSNDVLPGAAGANAQAGSNCNAVTP